MGSDHGVPGVDVGPCDLGQCDQSSLLERREQRAAGREVGVQRGRRIVGRLGERSHGHAGDAVVVDQVGGQVQQQVAPGRSLAGPAVGLR